MSGLDYLVQYGIDIQTSGSACEIFIRQIASYSKILLHVPLQDNRALIHSIWAKSRDLALEPLTLILLKKCL